MAMKDQYIFIREAQLLRKWIKELQQEIGKDEYHLAKLDTEMIYRDFTTHSITNYKILLVKRT